MVFGDPVTRVGNEILPHRSTLWSVEVERVSPVVAGALAVRIVLGKSVMVAVIGTQVVVDDVKDHPHVERVSLVDEPPHVFGRAVMMKRREEVDTVITPAVRTG